MRRFVACLLGFVLMLCTCVQVQAALRDRSQRVLVDSLKNCLREARFYTNDRSAVNFAKARNYLALAFNNPLGKDNVEVLLQAGNTEYQCFQTERNKPAKGKSMDEKIIYNSSSQGYLYYRQAFDLLVSPGHKASRRVVSELQTRAYELFRVTQGFRATAGYYYKKGEWAQAYKMFKLGLEAIDDKMLANFAMGNAAMSADYDNYRSDSIRTQLMFACAVTAIKMGDHVLAIQHLESVKERGHEQNLVYQQLCSEYFSICDTSKYEQCLIEASKLMPEERWYPEHLLNYYLQQPDVKSALRVIDHVITTTPNNAHNIELKGRLLEEVGNIIGAEHAYKTALRMDSTMLLSYINLGRIVFNRAVVREEAYVDARRFDEIYTDIVPLYEEALPYYYKAYELDGNRAETSIAIAIRTILYKRFQHPKCKKPKALIAKYNEVSRAYGLKTL